MRRGEGDESLHAWIYKGDQAELDLAALPEGMRPAAAYEVLKPGRGQAGARAIARFARQAWFVGAREITSNFRVGEEEEGDIDVEELYAELRGKKARNSSTSISGAPGRGRPGSVTPKTGPS